MVAASCGILLNFGWILLGLMQPPGGQGFTVEPPNWDASGVVESRSTYGALSNLGPSILSSATSG